MNETSKSLLSSESDAQTNPNASTNNYMQLASNQEDDTGEELLRNQSDSVAELCVASAKSKAIPSEETKFMER